MRYFVIYFQWGDERTRGFGLAWRTLDKFPNRIEFEESAKNLDNAVITNIQELSKEDYEEFTRVPESQEETKP